MAKQTPTRIPSANIVTGSLPVISENNPDTVFLSPNKYLIVKNNSKAFTNYLTTASSAYESAGTRPDLNALAAASKTTVEQKYEIDTVDLTDIESITYEQYYDSISKLVKYKAILKIRNSSPNKTEVQGVDARIYNPNA